jgi:hypothetical protein
MPRPALGPTQHPIQWASEHFRCQQVAARSWPIHFYLPPPRLQEQMCLTAHTYYGVTCHCRLRDSRWTVVAHRLDPRIEDMQLTVVCGHDTTCIPRRRKWCENSEPSTQTGHYSRSATVPTVLGRASGCGCVCYGTWHGVKMRPAAVSLHRVPVWLHWTLPSSAILSKLVFTCTWKLSLENTQQITLQFSFSYQSIFCGWEKLLGKEQAVTNNEGVEVARHAFRDLLKICLSACLCHC